MADYKAFSPRSWRAFQARCAALFPFLKKTFQGTTAEWDALSSAEKANYDIANITDDEVGTHEYYSTTETKTNKVWIDGKPIYRKVLQLISNEQWVSDITPVSDSNYQHNEWPADVGIFTNCYAISERNNGDFDKLASLGEDSIVGFVPNLQQGTFYYVTGGDMPKYAYTILEYTKTTD